MRAAYYDVNGAAAKVLRVGEVATPEPGPGEVRIKLKTSGVNPSDVKRRAGGGLISKMAFPRVVPHNDGAGELDKIGDGVPPSRLGERVWVWNAQWQRAFGTAAEFIVLPQHHAVPLPRDVSFEIGAGLGVPALTAWYAVTSAEAENASVLLVPGGAGAVGFYAIQMAKMKGAQVITTVSSADKAKVAAQAGADVIIDYKREDVATRISEVTGKRGVDAILEVDLGAGARMYPSILRPHSRVVVYGTIAPEQIIPASFCLANNISVRFIMVYDMPPVLITRAIADISKMLADNRLTHNIALTVPLDNIVAAHLAVERGTIGKVVVTVA
jgi:NADPH2:quinone reductase